MLAFESITVGLTVPVMITLADVPRGTALALGLGLALACLVVAGLLRAEWAYWLGHAVQVAAVALGFVVALMFVLGPLFALLWATAFGLGRKIERERAEAYAAFAEREAAGDADRGPDHESES